MPSETTAKPIPVITWRNMAPPFEEHAYFQGRDHFGFAPDDMQFSLANAWWLSEAALLAYADEAFAAPRFEAAGFDDVRFLSGRSTQCYVAVNPTFAVVAFRGTECRFDRGAEAIDQFMADLGADIDLRWTTAAGGGKIHRGFDDALNEIWSELSTILASLSRKGRALWITGHSLGGALAVLAASRFPDVCPTYTFGGPRVGNGDFASRFHPTVFRVVNNNDIVPHLPPFPYVNLGSLHYIDSLGDLHVEMNFWERRKDEIRGHIQCVLENVRNLHQGLSATLPDGLKDHTPLLYALHLWNNLIKEKANA